LFGLSDEKVTGAGSGLADGGDDAGRQLLQLGGERGGDRGDLAGGELAEGGGEFGEGSGCFARGGEIFFDGRAEGIATEAGLGAGEGEGLQGLELLAGRPPTPPARRSRSSNLASRFCAYPAAAAGSPRASAISERVL
jgi:hypothetical protein